jgi:hypothetical protein
MVHVAVLSLLLIMTPAAAAEPPTDKKPNPPTPDQQFEALKKEYQTKYADAVKAFRQAKTDQEKNKLRQDARQLGKDYCARALRLAEDNPKAPCAVKALTWVIDIGFADKPTEEKAVSLLLADHFDSDQLGRICPQLAESHTPQNLARLRRLMDKSPHKSVQAIACLSLAEYFKDQATPNGKPAPADADKLRRDAEALLERVLAKYPDVQSDGQKLAKTAQASLFELRNLALGMVAPEIQGEDVDGHKFKLSDYRGKVVLLDFWGNW